MSTGDPTVSEAERRARGQVSLHLRVDIATANALRELVRWVPTRTTRSELVAGLIAKEYAVTAKKRHAAP